MLYFDHNASSPLCAPAREAWLDAVSRFVGNASSPHRLGARADAALTVAREKLAAALGCDPGSIVWTSGATESNNTVIRHFCGEGEAWVSAIEHPCVLESVKQLFAGRFRLIPVNSSGVIEIGWLETAFRRSKPAFVVLMAANNETGVLQPWKEAGALCRENGVPFFCDAAQWLGKLPSSGLGECDFLSGCAHKFGGPQGVGFLKCPVRLRPLLYGGSQEDGRRAGTENVAGILAMVAALEARTATGEATERVQLRSRFEEELSRLLPGVEIIGAGTDRLWNTISVVMPEIDCRQRWVVKLDKLGFAVSTGSACASGKEESSHVLRAMGCSSAPRVLRFSSGWETTQHDWDQLLDGIRRAYAELTGL
ncbi:MAG: Cysteine desulfurase [Chthoniobacteraceae bacterium]|nr:Cysteine desulfurase [Chthoniobacteraceae bacterium]